MPLPDDLDHDKLAEAALAILALTAFSSRHESRAWKGLDWDVLDLLYRRGWIEDPVGKAKSVVSDRGWRTPRTRAASAPLREGSAMTATARTSSTRRAW